jgi:peptide/nickel transport system substrate-binding protein
MKHFYKPLLLLLTTAVLLLGGCGVQQTASEQEKNITAENSAVVLAAGRHLAPGEKDGYYCSKILGVWEPLITKDENGLPKPCLGDEGRRQRMDLPSAPGRTVPQRQPF